MKPREPGASRAKGFPPPFTEIAFHSVRWQATQRVALHEQGIPAEGASLFPDPRSPEGRHKVRGKCPAGFLLAEARRLRGHSLDERGLGLEARHPDDPNRGLAIAGIT